MAISAARLIEMLNEIQPAYDFGSDADFIEEGYLDSFDIITLVTALEEEYSVSISALEIIPENFSSLEAIINLVNSSPKTDFQE